MCTSVILTTLGNLEGKEPLLDLPMSELTQVFKKDFVYLFIFRERVREGEREGEKHQCVVALHVPPTGDLARNPGTCPDLESSRPPFGLQSGIQSPEAHQPGTDIPFFNEIFV